MLGVWEACRLRGKRPTIALAADINPFALAVYRKNFLTEPGAATSQSVEELFDGRLGSRTTPGEITLQKRVGRPALLIAGPPCQGHSDLNNSTRRHDPRNALYLVAIRAVEVLKPRAVIIENVPTVIHDRDRVVGVATDALASLGYSVTHAAIEVVRLGLAQNRKRHVLIALAGGRTPPDCEPPALTGSGATVWDAIGDLEHEADSATSPYRTSSKMTPENRERVKYLFTHRTFELPDRLRPPCHQNGHSYPSMYGRLHPDRPAQTITSGFGSMGQGRFVHPTRPRTITPHEAARLQGFPDFFDFECVSGRVQLQQMIGNAIPPQLAAHVFGMLLDRGLT